MACSQSAGIAEVARIMADYRVHCVVVIGVADNPQNEPTIRGIVSDLDLLTWATGPDVHAPARTVARHPIVSVAPDSPLHEAAAIMAQQETQHLVVREAPHHTPLGILSALDIASVLARGNP